MSNWLEIAKTIAPYVSAAGQVAGAVGAGRAAGRAQENAATRAGNLTALDRYAQEQRAKLEAARLVEEATQDRADRVLTNSRDRAQQVGLGDLLANLQDVEVGGLPSYIPKVGFSGGLRPSALGPMSRQAGTNLAQQALAAQMSGSDIPALPDVRGIGTNAPELSPLQQAGGLDRALNWIGYAGMPAQAYEEHKRAQEEKARLEREEARRVALEGQRQAQYTTPTAVPTDLTGRTPLVSATGLFGRQG